MKFYIKTKTGRRANGFESDRGSLNHAVPENSYHALCGAEPGRRADWSSYSGDRVTCPKCINKLAGIQDPEIIK